MPALRVGGRDPGQRTAGVRRARAAGGTVPRVRLLVVEDEVDLADALARGLRHEGYAVDVAHDGDDALERLGVTAYDLVCLDLNLPDVDGLEVCRRLRTDPAYAPGPEEPAPRVLMLTARDSIDDRVGGLDVGADDYLVKPFAFAELAARVRTLLRRDAGRTGAVLEVGELRLDTARFEALARRPAARPHGQGVRAAALLHEPRRRGALPGAPARARVGRARRPVHQHGAGHGRDAAPQAVRRRRGPAHRDRHRPRLPPAPAGAAREPRATAPPPVEASAWTARPPVRAAGLATHACRSGWARSASGSPRSTRCSSSAWPRSWSAASTSRWPTGCTTSRSRRRSTTTVVDAARAIGSRGGRRAGQFRTSSAGSTSGRSQLLRSYSFGALGLLFLASLGVGWVVAGRVLAPIGRITGVARDIQATDLSRRIALAGPARRAARTWPTPSTGCSARIDEAFESQRRFIQEASHELRNPLAVIRTNLDVALADPRRRRTRTSAGPPRSCGAPPSGCRTSSTTCWPTPAQGATVRQFERLDAGRAWSPTRPPSSRCRPRPGASRSSAGRRAGPVRSIGDRVALRQALANLLANAVRLAPEGSTIRVAAGREGTERRGGPVGLDRGRGPGPGHPRGPARAGVPAVLAGRRAPRPRGGPERPRPDHRAPDRREPRRVGPPRVGNPAGGLDLLALAPAPLPAGRTVRA